VWILDVFFKLFICFYLFIYFSSIGSVPTALLAVVCTMSSTKKKDSKKGSYPPSNWKPDSNNERSSPIFKK